MRFHADLHIHSKYSRATSRDCDLEHLAWWARRKGLTVVATGDFAHPAWFEEIREKLVPAEPGLFRLRPDIEREVLGTLPAACQGPVRFLLEVEISTIYKLDEKTRKVHHLIYAATIETASRFRDRLAKVGNIASDGRPILGLDSRHLLEIALESGDDAYLVPAHVWTPWFAVLGSKSGFDSVSECYGDLSGHIFAVETGLSSDPPMNWRVSGLDRYTLVSNSDAHSPPMLGREACVFETELDYFAMRRALQTGEGFGGTVEFFPEEGKYHLDGHRSCAVRLEPRETRRRRGLCPSCGKAVTVGVLHRVETLADRPEGARPEGAAPFRSLVQLPEVVAELHGVGPKSKTVERAVSGLVSRLGPEMTILEDVPLEDVEHAADPLLAEALRRLRRGEVRREGGYDGEYGTIRLFEKEEISSQLRLFATRKASPAVVPPPSAEPETGSPEPVPGSVGRQASLPLTAGPRLLAALDPDQRAAAEILEGALLIVAGPGTGKTRTLVHRLAHLVARGTPASRCLAVTFTRRAATEMRQRLDELLPAAGRILVTTFHGLGLRILREQHAEVGLDRAFRIADDPARVLVAEKLFALSRAEAAKAVGELAAARREGRSDERLPAYRQALWERELVDFEDLLALPLELFAERPGILESYQERFRHISVDEYQDVDALQYRLLRLLAGERGNLCAIGDPDQAIYAFRGADVGFFLRFQEDFPAARLVELGRNYRSQPTVLRAALQAVAPTSLVADRRLVAAAQSPPEPLVLLEAASERAEAEIVVRTIEEQLGGTSYFSVDSGRVRSDEAALPEELSFDDIAILYRTHAQADALVEALERAGMPYQKRSHERLLERDEVRLLVHVLEGQPGEDGASVLDRLHRARREAGGVGDAALDEALELVSPLAERHGDDLGSFLAELALGAEVDTWDPRAERLSLLTLHAAKGLEFPVVFLVGCEDTLLPFSPPWDDAAVDVAEERRLFFVGMTRARSRLYLSWARRRRLRSEVLERRPSPFLSDLAEELLRRRREAAPRRRHRGNDVRQLRLL